MFSSPWKIQCGADTPVPRDTSPVQPSMQGADQKIASYQGIALAMPKVSAIAPLGAESIAMLIQV